jgi:hypothetical protein
VSAFCAKTAAPVATATCQPVGAEGAACAGFVPADDCQAGLVCRPNAGYDGGTCAKPGRAGDRCFYDTFLVGGGPSCDEGLVCDEMLAQPVCVPLHAEGEACGTDDACGPGLQCIGIVFELGGGVFQTGTCLRPKAMGAACDSDNDCFRLALCERGQCTPMTPPGKLCSNTDDVGDSCAVGYCSPMSHLCVDKPAIGGHCDTKPGSNASACPFPADCDVETSTCKLDCGSSGETILGSGRKARPNDATRSRGLRRGGRL